jgi:hypothetical protein
MLKKSFVTGAIAIACSAVFMMPTFAQVPTSIPQVHQLAAEQLLEEQPLAQRDPQEPSQRDDSLEDSELEELNEENTAAEETASNETPVTVSLRLNTELFANSGDLVEFLVPIRYDPSDRLALEAVPVMKYFPESSSEEFDYGIKFVVEYRL